MSSIQMLYPRLWKIIMLVCLAQNSNCCTDENPKRPIVSALLDLYSGQKCDTVNFYGLQQAAALQSSLKKINLEYEADKLEIKMQIFDCCTSAKGARIASLKALVAAEQTCMQTPLFLGILGNERKENFDASFMITKVFNLAHILPYTYDSEMKIINNVHIISSYPVKQHTQSMKLLLLKIGMRRVSVVYENLSTTKMKADHMAQKLQNDFCFIRTINFIDTDNIKRQLGPGEHEDGLVLLLENISALDKLSDALNNYEKSIIISVGKVGIQSPYFTIRKSVYILQMSSLTPIGNLTDYYEHDMLVKYDLQQMGKCLEKSEGHERMCSDIVIQGDSIRERDWTTDLLEYGLMQYASSVRIAAFKKCRVSKGNTSLCSELHSFPRDEWNDILKESTTFSKPNKLHSQEKITFNMNIPAKFTVFLSESVGLQLVGRIENNLLHIYNGYQFPEVQPFPGPEKCNETIIITETTPTPGVNYQTPILVEVEQFFNLNTSDLELIGFLSGIVCAILCLFAIAFYGVYRTVRVKSHNSDSSLRGSSHETTNSE